MKKVQTSENPDDQPVYVSPESPTYVVTDNSRLSEPYDYPGVVKQPPTAVDKEEGYAYARTLQIGSLQSHSQLKNANSSPPTIIREDLDGSKSLPLNDGGRKRPISEADLVIPSGSVKQLSGLFDTVSTERVDSPETTHQKFKLAVDQTNRPPDSPRSSSFSKSLPAAPLTDSRVSVSSTGKAVKKVSLASLDSKASNDSCVLDEVYDNCQIDENRFSPSSNYPGNQLPLPPGGPSPLLSNKPKSHSVSSVTMMPLPSLPTEEDDREVYDSPNTRSPAVNVPTDSSGYLSLVDTTPENKVEEENPYYKSLLAVEEEQSTYEQPIQRRKDDPYEEDETYDNPILKVEEDPYDNPDMTGGETRPISQDVYSSIKLDDSAGYDYCPVNNFIRKEDDTYEVPSLNEKTEVDKKASTNVSNQQENIYY